jgi:hypothetical protein
MISLFKNSKRFLTKCSNYKPVKFILKKFKTKFLLIIYHKTEEKNQTYLYKPHGSCYGNIASLLPEVSSWLLISHLGLFVAPKSKRDIFCFPLVQKRIFGVKSGPVLTIGRFWRQESRVE